MANDLLYKLKFLTKYTLPIFLSNIQISLKKTQDEFNKFKHENTSELEFKTPKYVDSLKEKYLKEEIKIIEERTKINRNKQNEKKIQFTTQEKKYFNQFYPNLIRPRENKIKYKKKNIKKYLYGKNIVKTKYKLFDGKNSKKVNLKSEWIRYFQEDKNFFKDCQEEKIDTTDNLRYTDFIEKYDAYGNLKERNSFMFRQSISSRVPEQGKNQVENPILDSLISRQKENDSEDILKNNYQSSDVEEEKENDEDVPEKNKNLIKQSSDEEELEEKVKGDDLINNISLKNKNNEYIESKEENQERNDKSEKDNKNKKPRKSKLKNEKPKEKSEDNLEKKEKVNENKNNSNLLDLVSEKNKNEKTKLSKKNETKINSKNFDLAKAIKKTNDISNKKPGKALINSESDSDSDSSSDEKGKVNENLNINKGTTNSLFSFGDSNINITEVKENNKGNQSNENMKANSLNNHDSSLVNSSKSDENDSNKLINSNNSKKSNENESNYEENENNTYNENDPLSFNNKSNEDLSNKEKEKIISINSKNNKSNRNINSNNLNSFNTEKFSEKYEINKINENKNNTSKNSKKSNSKEQLNSKYDYLNELSPNRKYIINIKLNNLNKEKNKLERNNNTASEKNSNKNITDLDAFEKLRDINFSLDNEKSLSTYFKRINKENNINNALKENSRNRSKKSTKYSQEMTVQSTNSNYDNIFYPNVYYINEDKNLHTKTHVSMLFSNLKNQNNIYNQEENN